MRYKQFMLIICIIACILFTVSCAFANDAANETISQNELACDLQLSGDDADNTIQTAGDSLYDSVVYFNASSNDDGDGSKSNPYKYYKSDRISYGSTAYFADGIYDITEANYIYSSPTYKTTFIGQSIENTVLRSNLANRFDFTVTDNSCFVLNNLTMIGVHINNQANLMACDVVFRNSESFNPDYPPTLSYSNVSKIYDSTYGGVIICDTLFNKVTTLNLTGCYFKDNSASSGGVIATYNTIANIQNCVFYNSTSKRFGGAVYSIKSNLTIQNSSFMLNDAKYGGAIYANCSSLNLRDSKFNMSRAFSFGGVIASFSSRLDIDHVVFHDYASLDDAGGAIYSIAGTLDIADSSFRDGYSDFGGAICNLKCDCDIRGCEFINNTAVYYGGSIYNMYGNIEIVKNKFNSTHAASGGSIFNRLSDSFILSDNRFINSTADEGDIVFVDGNKVNVIENANVYDSSFILLKYGNVYDIDYYESVPIINYLAEPVDVLPSSYDSRKYGYITPAKDQIQGGNCWAFSGIATLEACLKKATGIDYDFSEENVKNLMYEYSLFDSDSVLSSGGNLYMLIAYLTGWIGPVYDEYDVYDDYSSLSAIYDSVVHVQNVYVLPERENFLDNDRIKMAVMEYGAVSVSIESEQHAVTIVGWDDEFTSNDYLGNKAVGAWIIKNSWGPDWGYDGFGYLSYQQKISYGYTFILNNDRGYSNIYQYDFGGKRGFYTLNGKEVYIKNKFTAENDEILSAFSTYFYEPTNFTASIYVNGQLATTQDGWGELGYYTIPLENEISLKKGDSFEVSLKIFNGEPVYFPICAADEINKINFGKGISFYSVDGVNWNDLHESNSPGVAWIKAFTRLKNLTEISIDVDQFGGGGSNPFDNINVDDLVTIQLNLPQYYVDGGIQHSIGGLVTFKINDQYYFAQADNGKVCLNITFEKEGVYNVTAQFKSSRIVSNSLNFTVNVVRTDPSTLLIQANDVSKFYGGPEKYVARFSKDGELLKGVYVTVSANGKNYTVKTDDNGQVILDLNLTVGAYDVYAKYGGKVVSSKFTVLTTLDVNDIRQDFYDSYVYASFLNTDGNVLSNREVSFVIGTYEFKVTTDNAGFATTKINIYSGKYPVSVVNPVNGEKKEFTLEVSKIDSQCSLSVTQAGSAVTINATISMASSSSYVNFIVMGNVYRVNVKSVVIDNNIFPVASLRLDNLAVGDYNVTAIFSGDDNLRVSSDSRKFSVTNNPYLISSKDYGGYYGSSGTVAKITDYNGNPVKGQVVYATISNKTYNSTTDADGNAYFMPNLEVGVHPVLFEYNGQSLLKHVHVYSTITVANSTSEYLNSNIGAYFIYPKNGGQSTNALDVKFIINGTEYSATTDSRGYASVNVDLPVGTHTFTAVNLCNGERKQLEIKIYKSTPAVTLTKSKRGDGILLTASLKQSSAIGNVVFTMNSKKYTIAVIDGKAILAMNVLEEGYYEVYANYIGDFNFNNILSDTIKFDYAHTNYTLEAANISKYYGGSEKFTVTLYNYNKPVSNAIVNVSIGDWEFGLKTDSMGVASFDDDLNPGIYIVHCSYDDKTVVSEINIKSTVTIISPTLDVSYSKITAEIRDGNGNLVKNRLVTFKIDSSEFKQTTDGSGIVTWDANLDRGNYWVATVNPVTGEVKYSTLIISKATPNLILSAVREYGADVLKAVLPKAATGEVNFVLDNGDVYSVEIKDGVSVLEGLDPGEYTVDVTYTGNDEFNPVSKTIKFLVSEAADAPLASVLSSSKVTTTYGVGKNIVVTLKDSKGNVLVGRKITVNLNNKNYEAIIPTDGEAIVYIPSSLPAKTYTATITYGGEANILPSTLRISVVVNKATPKLTASKKTFKHKDKTKKYTVTLKSNNNKKQRITIKVNGKTYSAKTNSKGKAIFKLSKLNKKGTFKAKVKYSGNSNYRAVIKNVKIIVK